MRKELGLTQDEFAKACKVTLRTVQNWEKDGQLTPRTISQLESLKANSKKFAPSEGVGCESKESLVPDLSTVVGLMNRQLNELEQLRQLLQNKNERIDRIIALLETK